MTTTSRVGSRHLDAEPAGDLVAHAGKAVFAGGSRPGARGLPELVQFARQAAGRADDHVASAWRALHRADHLRVGRQLRVGRRPCTAPTSLPASAPSPSRPSRSMRRAPSSRRSAARQFLEPGSGVGDQRQRAVLGRRRSGCTLRPMMRRSGFLNSAHEPVVKSCSRVPTASTTSASSRQRVGGGRAGDADGAEVERMIVRQARLAGLRLADRNAVPRRRNPRASSRPRE